jgi:hypothetical protein
MIEPPSGRVKKNGLLAERVCVTHILSGEAGREFRENNIGSGRDSLWFSVPLFEALVALLHGAPEGVFALGGT